MLTRFALAHFQFFLHSKDRLALHPRNPGNSLRGAFGSTFKRLVCPTPVECRQTCRMKATCPYGQIFEPSPPPGSDRLALNHDIPRPFILRPPHGIEAKAQPGESLHFELILIGKANDYLPYFLVTFRELEQQGIGLGRGRYEISRVVQIIEPSSVTRQPVSVTQACESERIHQAENGQRRTDNGAIDIYSSTDQLVRPTPHRLSFKDCRHLAAHRFTNNDQRLTVRFITPTHLKADGKIVGRPDFHHVIKRLRDRINALAHFYCDDTLDVDHKAFGERAERVQTISCNVRWEDRDRRSWRTGLSHDMGGFVGEVTYEGKMEEFLPLLILGQYTHVGKYSVWGNGQYEIVA